MPHPDYPFEQEFAAPVEAQVAELRERLRALPGARERAAGAFARFAALWRGRLESGWTPPEGSLFPWAQVRRSLEALLPGTEELPQDDAGAGSDGAGPFRREDGAVIALILAGNTPLLAWPALYHCLMAGGAVYAKMSRDETLWPRLFVEALAEVDPELVSLVRLAVWPGEDARTGELVRAADAVVAYGGDATIDALRSLAPSGTPFFGFGHAISIGLWVYREQALQHPHLWRGFAADTLMYDQGGCRSLHGLYVQHGPGRRIIPAVVNALAEAFPGVVKNLGVPPVTDPAAARIVREARDLALFEGATVRGADDLRWTIIGYPETRPLPVPLGHCILPVIPVLNFNADLPASLGPLEDRLSCVAWAGVRELRGAWPWISPRMCGSSEPGWMQTPPVDWQIPWRDGSAPG